MPERHLTEYDPPDDDVDEGMPHASGRSRGVALVLGVLGGVFGLHRFYAGRIESGVWMAVTIGGLGFWWLYDMVMLIAGEFRDADGLPLRQWAVADVAPAVSGDPRQISALTEHVEHLERQLGELAERVDFAERLLTQQRERDRLPRG
jgi:TM2 domain-containing membrane protein YozV